MESWHLLKQQLLHLPFTKVHLEVMQLSHKNGIIVILFCGSYTSNKMGICGGIRPGGEVVLGGTLNAPP